MVADYVSVNQLNGAAPKLRVLLLNSKSVYIEWWVWHDSSSCFTDGH